MMRLIMVIALGAVLFNTAQAEETSYKLQPGDILDVSIWGQEASRRQVIVLPDGTISYPLAGHFSVIGMTATDAEAQIRERLVRGGFFVEEPQLSVAVAQPQGYQVFVLGKVRGPGALTATRRLSVVQALSLAGGLDRFASANKLTVIRRDKEGHKVLPVDYAAIRSGRDLSTNIILEPGDVLIVPEATLF